MITFQIKKCQLKYFGRSFLSIKIFWHHCLSEETLPTTNLVSAAHDIHIWSRQQYEDERHELIVTAILLFHLGNDTDFTVHLVLK